MTSEDSRPLSDRSTELLLAVRQVRRDAQKASRSGNPAKRALAERALEAVGPTIQQIYATEAGQ